MRVSFAKVSYEDVHETRENALQNYKRDSISWSLMKEQGLHYLKRLPFFVMWIALFDIYLKYCNKTVTSKVCTVLGIEHISLKFLTMVFIMGLFIIFSYKAIFSLTEDTFPRKTPIYNKMTQNHEFYIETQYLESATAIMNKLQLLSKEDIANSELIIDEKNVVLFIRDSKLGYTEKYNYAVKSEEMMKILRETGELDFSFIDADWKMLKEQYMIEHS